MTSIGTGTRNAPLVLLLALTSLQPAFGCVIIVSYIPVGMWLLPWTLLALATWASGRRLGAGLTLGGGLALVALFSGAGTPVMVIFLSIALLISVLFMVIRKSTHWQALVPLALAACLTYAPLVVENGLGVPAELRNGCSVACNSNLKNIGTALEQYSADNGGFYPEDLSALTPKYLNSIPRCIWFQPSELGEKIYAERCRVYFKEYGYRSETSPEPLYNVSCQTGVHPAVKSGYPQYTSVEGLVSGY